MSVTIDWCEENYAVSPHIAEFWNTLTAVLTVFPAIWWLTQRNPPGTQQFRLLHLNVVILQIGSALFHGTLTWIGQLLDEVPILMWCCFSICLTFDTWTIRGATGAKTWIRSTPNGVKKGSAIRGETKVAPTRFRWAPGPRLLFLLGAIQVFATVYIYVTHHKFYETFLSVVLIQAGLHWPIIMSELYGRLAGTENIQQLKQLLALHVGIGYSGFLIWTIENVVCSAEDGLTQKIIIQSLHLHALWHIMAIVSLKYWHDFLVLYRLSVLAFYSRNNAKADQGRRKDQQENRIMAKISRENWWGLGNRFLETSLKKIT